MKKKNGISIRNIAWILVAALCFVSFGGASIWKPVELGETVARYDRQATATLRELNRLGVLGLTPQSTIEELLTYQRNSGKSLADILAMPTWAHKLGLLSMDYQATWYMANPFEVLPQDLQAAI